MIQFPKLVNIGKNLCKLDWSEFDKKNEINYNNWVQNHWKYRIVNNGKFVKTLDEKWEKFIDRQFLINDDLSHFIEYTKKIAIDVFDTTYVGLDTVEREKILEIGEKAIEVYLRLLSEKITPFSIVDKYLFTTVSLTKFWMHQTGRGLVYELSLIDDTLKKSNTTYSFSQIKDFDTFLKNKLVEIDKSYTFYSEDEPIVIKRIRNEKLKNINERV